MVAAALVLVSLAFATRANASVQIELDTGWQFRTDPQEVGETTGWIHALPPATRRVDLPHTWNIGVDHDFLGVGWYFLDFEGPAIPLQGHAILHFGATFYSAKIWLNGVAVGAHEGGYTSYEFDVTRHLRTRNLLAVRIDNRPGAATIPGLANRGESDAWYDWWPYGGIVRDVGLRVTGPAWIERQAIRTTLEGDAATVTDRVFLRGSATATHAGTVRVSVLDEHDIEVAKASRPFVPGDKGTQVSVELRWQHPELWSLDRPYLYRVRAQVVTAQSDVAEESAETFGVRTVEIRDRHLLLNGQRVRLTGMTRHEDSPAEGLAETRGTMLRDYNEMKALHTTLTRPVHYPQNPFVLDYADRNGILLIPEIPVWHFSEAQLADPKVQALARRQMREMIEEDGNHPSIFAWSVANESATATPEGIAYFRMMRDWIRKLDPDRYVSFADDKLPAVVRAEQSAANDADFLMMNEYYGSWHGPAAELPAALDHVDATFPQKMVIISEFGYAGIFSHSPAKADQARIRILQEQFPILAARDWIAGAILWCYQDYKSRRNLWPGQTEGYVEHGLVDENRQRKPSYEVWKGLSAPAHVDLAWTFAGSGNSSLAGFTARVLPNAIDRLPAVPLHKVHLDWNLLDGKGESLQSGKQYFESLEQTIEIREILSTGIQGAADRLVVRLLDSRGDVIDQELLPRPNLPRP
jgi:beta-glucuronidase